MVTTETKKAAMATVADYWFVRLPDGRTLRSRSTESLRQHLKAGRIPWDSRVRRSAEEPWQPLDKAAEFADLAPDENDDEPANRGPRLPGKKKERASEKDMRTLGVRGLLEELFNAFDVSLQKAKLTTAALTGLLMGITIIFGAVSHYFLPDGWKWSGYVGAGFVLCVLFSACTSIITQMTALELSRFRPAQFDEVRSGLARTILRLTIAFTLVGGAIGGLIYLLHSLPGWLSPTAAGEDGACCHPSRLAEEARTSG